MKALVISDHDPKINVVEMVQRESIELIITLGDLTREDLLPVEQVKSIPKIGVYGNHDSGRYMDEIGIWDMHLKTWTYNGISFGGFQGCVRYKDNPQAIMCTQEEASALINGFPEVDVFLSLCPPRGINDEDDTAHQGFEALRDYIDTHMPKVWLHGHTYPADEVLVRQHSVTRIEYVTRYRIVEL